MNDRENASRNTLEFPYVAELMLHLHATVSVENMISRHIRNPAHWSEVGRMADEFATTGYTKATNLVPSALVNKIEAEIDDAFNERGVRRDLFIEATENTPRNMSNLRFTDIRDTCPSLAATYDSRMLKLCLSAIVGESVFECPWEHERYISTLLHQAGDTHGWHWDDYAYSLLWVLRAPPSSLGGNLEFVSNTNWNKLRPDINRIVNEENVEVRTHKSGDLYLFRSDRLLHRVTPIAEGTERLIVNMVYANKDDVSAKKTHETMTELFA